ncbi:MAG: hypothetical protein F4213_21615 [Boseongicola sp. SB0677_bin_26]|nr:hypothetical protein [Boseongicola sp. SB0665_bin_10]MYG28579.1 hypothetical protein [Boseongicola sp. SB0677_bin_26]
MDALDALEIATAYLRAAAPEFTVKDFSMNTGLNLDLATVTLDALASIGALEAGVGKGWDRSYVIKNRPSQRHGSF